MIKDLREKGMSISEISRQLKNTDRIVAADPSGLYHTISEWTSQEKVVSYLA